MGLVGLMNVLKLEGARKDVRANCLAPSATTRMTENISELRRGSPSLVSPAVLYLCSENAPKGMILHAAGGRFFKIQVCETAGIDLGDDVSYERFLEHVDDVVDDKSLEPRDRYRS